MKKCQNCTKWKREKSQEKFAKGGAYARPEEGWCGILLTSSTDVCPKWECKK